MSSCGCFGCFQKKEPLKPKMVDVSTQVPTPGPWKPSPQATAATTALRRQSTSNASSPAAKNQERIIVIGAGAAGLAAARELKAQSGKEVLVLEGRSRIGGRILTSHFADGSFIDLGAYLVYGDGPSNPVMSVFNEAGVKMSRHFDSESIKLYEAAGPSGDKPAQKGEFGYLELGKMTIAHTNLEKAIIAEGERRIKEWPNIPDISLLEGIKTVKGVGWTGFAGFHTYDARMQQVLRSLGAAEAENGFACNIEDLSLTWAGAKGKVYEGSEGATPEGGWSKFTEHLAKDLDIRLNSKVTAVKNEGRGVVVELESGEKLNCLACVCTLPLGVLKAEKVAFEPALPQAKLSAIRSMGFGTQLRVAVQFDKCFWGDSVYLIRVMTEEARRTAESMEWTLLTNWNTYLKNKVIVGLCSGRVAVESCKKTDEELGEWMKTLLESMLGEKAVKSANIVQVQTARWQDDEFSLGAITCPVLGSSIDMLDELAAPHGRVFFAGDSTDKDRPGKVDGAYSSGLRAAKEVMDLLN